jgi:hypothetical protein
MKSIIKNFTVNRYWIITILLAAAKLLIHFLTNTRYKLLRDEMLFFNMGEHLSAGYATVPLVTGFLAFLMNKIFGFSVFGIRFFPALMGAVSVYVIASIVKALGGGLTELKSLQDTWQRRITLSRKRKKGTASYLVKEITDMPVQYIFTAKNMICPRQLHFTKVMSSGPRTQSPTDQLFIYTGILTNWRSISGISA